MDAVGHPLADVWIDHAALTPAESKTDSQGRFKIETRAPAVVFRKGGFQSKYLRVGPGGEKPLVIILPGPAPQMTPCDGAGRCLSLKYFGSAFCLPKIRGVHVSKEGNDIDYGCRSFWIAMPDGRVGVQHCSGPMWGSGLPADEDVWSAAVYRETAYQDRQGFLITDARGESQYGRCWRVLGHPFEAVEYRGVSARDPAVLDRVIDGACLEPTAFGFGRRN
jgi:hypothetical protein